MDRESARGIEWDCAQLVHRFYGLLDAKRYDDLVKLFSRDGVWVRLGKPVPRDQLLKTMGERESWVTAHLVTNLQVRVIDADRAETEQYITLYRHEGWAGKDKAPPVTLPLAVLHHRDRMVREDGIWKIQHKSSRQIMIREQTHAER